ncbi:unnamed protein product, partial [Chrysoparadoxa australica]
MTIVGGTTETSSTIGNSATQGRAVDVVLKCIVESPELFGPGLKKLWRWQHGLTTEELSDPAQALPAFLEGLGARLGLVESAERESHQGFDTEEVDGMEESAHDGEEMSESKGEE